MREVQECDCKKTAGPDGSVRFTLDVTTNNDNVVRTVDQNYGYQLDAGALPWGASIDLSGANPFTTQSKVPDDVGAADIAQILGTAAPRPYATAPPLFPGIC